MIDHPIADFNVADGVTPWIALSNKAAIARIMLPNAFSVILYVALTVSEQVSELCMAEGTLDIVQVNLIIVAYSHLATSDDIAVDVWSHIAVVFLVFEVVRVDEVADPFALVVVLVQMAYHVTSSLRDCFFALGPAEHLNVSVEDWVLLSDHSELMI